MCFLARSAPSGESLRGEGLVRLIGAVVCLLAACRVSNCTLTRAMDGRNLRCSTIGSCQSTATSSAAGRGIAAVSSAIEESHLYLLPFTKPITVSKFKQLLQDNHIVRPHCRRGLLRQMSHVAWSVHLCV